MSENERRTSSECTFEGVPASGGGGQLFSCCAGEQQQQQCCEVVEEKEENRVPLLPMLSLVVDLQWTSTRLQVHGHRRLRRPHHQTILMSCPALRKHTQTADSLCHPCGSVVGYRLRWIDNHRTHLCVSLSLNISHQRSNDL